MDLRELGEREAIARLHRAIGETGDLGGGQDDCSAVRMDDGTILLASTDLVIDTTHMLPGVTPGLLGRYAVEIAASDVAAMGGDPIGVLCAYAMPPDTDMHWLEGVTEGMARAANDHGTAVIGGDTKRSPERTIAVTALGRVAEEECMYRRGAKEGDALVLTGPVGGPAMGFNMERDPTGMLRDRALGLVYEVRARLRAGRALASSGRAHACIDLSDGLGPCLSQMMEASATGAELLWERLHLADGLEAFAEARGMDAREMALNWGGEYELLAAVDPDGVPSVLEALQRLGLEPAMVGRVHGDVSTNVIISEHGPESLRPHGFDHFQG
jgi:thiamine-monophosphate kinase